jgi:hypothetical protein
MSRQVSWLTGRRYCPAFPALMRQWPRSASARRLQLRGQLRPSQSGAPDSLFALALAHCDAREPRRRDYAGAAVIGQRNIKTSLYLRPMHARGLEGDAHGRARATGGKRRQTARYLGHSEAQFRGCELERARYSPRRMRPRRLVRFDCPSAPVAVPNWGLFSVGPIHVPLNSRNSIDYGAGPFPGVGVALITAQASRPQLAAAFGRMCRAKAN